MPRCATAGTSLDELLTLAIPLCQQAQACCPRTGPGRPPQYDDWKLAVVILCGVLKKLKSKSKQYRLVQQQAKMLCARLEMDAIPARSTFFDRYPRVWPLVQHAIRLQGRVALAEHVADAQTTAVDKSLVAARGPQWNQRDRRRGVVPKYLRGLDRDADWGISGTRKWTYGYSYEVAVTATRGSVVFPLLASADVASANEHRSFLAKAPQLPRSCRTVLADSGYDGNAQAEAVEGDRSSARTLRSRRAPRMRMRRRTRMRRRFLCPLARAPGAWIGRGRRERRRQQRAARHRFLQTRRGRKLYRRRGCTVEPFNAIFKRMFELDEHVWHRGLGNNQTQLLTAIFAYQLLIRVHWKRGGRDAQVQYLLDGL